jgi:hypothetical protein
MNSLAELVASRLAELKAQGIGQAEVASGAGKPTAQGLLSQVASGLKKFNPDELDAWADGLRYERGSAARDEFMRVAREAWYFLVPAETALGDDAPGLKLWREMIALRGELAATRTHLHRTEQSLAESEARARGLDKKVQALEKRLETLLRRGQVPPEGGGA